MDDQDRACTFDGPALATPVLEVEFVGIDCGLKGFISRIKPGAPTEVTFYPTPAFTNAQGHPAEYDEQGIFELVASWRGKVALVLLERQMPFKDNGAQGNFSVGYGYALWRMALIANGIPFQVLLPQQWKARMQVLPQRAKPGENKELDEKQLKQRRSARRKLGKNMAIKQTSALFPGLDLRKNERSRVPHDGKCEALLMAELARRLHAGR